MVKVFGLDGVKKLTVYQKIWALKNINKEREEDFNLIHNLIEIFKSWTDPRRYVEEKKKIEVVGGKNLDTFMDQLKQHGASSKELKSIESQYKK